MRKMKSSTLWIGALMVIAITCISPSCATANQQKIAAQRKGLMMQDSSEYSRNKRHYKGSKSYKKQLKRRKAYESNRVKRRR